MHSIVQSIIDGDGAMLSVSISFGSFQPEPENPRFQASFFLHYSKVRKHATPLTGLSLRSLCTSCPSGDDTLSLRESLAARPNSPCCAGLALRSPTCLRVVQLCFGPSDRLFALCTLRRLFRYQGASLVGGGGAGFFSLPHTKLHTAQIYDWKHLYLYIFLVLLVYIRHFPSLP